MKVIREWPETNFVWNMKYVVGFRVDDTELDIERAFLKGFLWKKFCLMLKGTFEVTK